MTESKLDTIIFKENIEQAADIIREGGLVAVPTETVYGLAGNGLCESAVKEIYRVKGRPEVKPLSLLVPGSEALDKYCLDVPQTARVLAERFWPGPLTIILKAKPEIPEIVRAGGSTVGLRCPDHPLTLELLTRTGLPLAAPSANPSDLPSPKNAQEVIAYFDGEIPGVIDGGECGIGRESTIIAMDQRPYKILRQGALDRSDIASALADRLTVIGFTGGSGSGKTTALKELEKRGALVIDCDEVYHNLVESDKELINEIESNFPGVVVDETLDRKRLGGVVFASPEKLNILNLLAHKYVSREVRRLLEDWAMAGGELAAVDAIELLSSGLGEKCTAVIGVLADRDRRVRRIMERDGISEDYARLRIEAQRPDSYFEEHCSHILRNDGDRNLFIKKINDILEEITENG